MKTRGLTEGALLAVVAAVLVVLGALPFVGAFVSLFWPVPVAMVTARRGVRLGVLSALVAAALVSLVLGPLQGGFVLAPLGLVGVAVGWTIRRQKSATLIWLVASAASALMAIATWALARWALGIDPLAQLGQAFIEGGRQAIEMYRRAGIPEGQLESIRRMTEAIPVIQRLLWPALLASTSLLLGWATYWATRLVMGRLGEAPPPLPTFDRVRMFPGVGVLYLGGWGALLLLNRSAPVEDIALGAAGPAADQALWFSAAFSAFVLGQQLLALNGLAVGYHFLRRANVSKPAGIALIALAALLLSSFGPALAQLPVWLGLWDVLFDYRKLGGSAP